MGVVVGMIAGAVCALILRRKSDWFDEGPVLNTLAGVLGGALGAACLVPGGLFDTATIGLSDPLRALGQAAAGAVGGFGILAVVGILRDILVK